jgi:hypothetical protein
MSAANSIGAHPALERPNLGRGGGTTLTGRAIPVYGVWRRFGEPWGHVAEWLRNGLQSNTFI